MVRHISPKTVYIVVMASGIWIAATLVGCSDSPPSKADAFRAAQQNAMTPHGAIELESVREADNGEIIYRTSDGSLWSVDAREEGDGHWRYGAPSRMEGP